jgi:hypothetical protein
MYAPQVDFPYNHLSEVLSITDVGEKGPVKLDGFKPSHQNEVT